MKRSFRRFSFTILLLSLAVLVCSLGEPQKAWASSGGRSGSSGMTGSICNGCHAGGTTPTVELTGPTSLATDASGTYTLTITGGAAVVGGLDVATSGGTLQATDSATKLKSGEVTHKASTPFIGNSLVFTFTLVAPSTDGTVTLYAAGLSADDDGSSSGDKSAAATLAVSVSSSGTTTPVPVISVTDSIAPNNDLSIPFSDLTEGLTSDQTVTITNTGNADLIIGTIAGTNPLAAPFSITTDNCSGQTVAPAGSCALTVRFAPTAVGASSDSFDIPSNDSATGTITMNVTGTGLSAATNNPPSAPTLVSPTDGQNVDGSTVSLQWNKSTDPDNDTLTYHVYNCTDSTFTSCTPVDVASRGMAGIYFAGSGLLFFGFVFTRGNRGRTLVLTLMIAALLMTGALFTSCGKSNDSNTAATSADMSHQVSGLNSATTYYWKVVADDGKGGLTSSPTWSFTTQ
jgi:hypothetical protein